MLDKRPFETLSDFVRAFADCPGPDGGARDAADARNAVLTKPSGALGRLEDIAIWYASWRGDAMPRITQPQIVIFAGNHGVTAQGVSAFPQEVTMQMVQNFDAGGAAINQLATHAGAALDVVSLHLDQPTNDFTQGPAMSKDGLLDALTAGWNSLRPQTDLLVVGEMGIGNTTSAAAIAALVCGGTAEDWVGRGTGIDDDGLVRKTAAVAKAIELHKDNEGPLDILARVGGREIAAMAGAMAAARASRVPVILDGFIASSAALVLHALDADNVAHVIAGHQSAETAHARVLAHLDKAPLLQLGLRLGEGSGAALAIQIVKGAVACHTGMATFADAGVSDG